jgi:succinyl-CoA synthetase alpha subunit
MVGFIAGVTAPSRPPHGHAGAIISGGKGDAGSKTAAMEAAGIRSRRRRHGSERPLSKIEVLIQSLVLFGANIRPK